jgi:uncharacterized protein YbjQ (UPF0145 family)
MEAAREQGGNAVLRVRTQVSVTSDPTAGVFCYSIATGTAVVLTDDGRRRQAANPYLQP